MPKRLCNQFLPKTLRFSLQRHKSCKKCSFLRLFAGFFMEESCFGFGKAGETSLLKKQANFKGEGKPTLSMRWFPLSLFIYPKLCSFGLLLKMRGAFSLRSSLSPTRGHPWTPKSFLCNSLVQKLQNSAYAEFLDGLPVFLWRNLVGVSSRRTGCVLNREGLCVKELNLFYNCPRMSPLAIARST